MSIQQPKITLEDLHALVLQNALKCDQQFKNIKAKQKNHEERLHNLEVGSPPTVGRTASAIVNTIEAEPTKVPQVPYVVQRAQVQAQPKMKWAKTGKEAYDWFQANGFTNSYSLIGAMRYILDKEEGYLDKSSGSKRKRSFGDFQKMAMQRPSIDDFRKRSEVMTIGIHECTLIQARILEMENDELNNHRKVLAVKGITDEAEIQKQLAAKRNELRLKQASNTAEKTEEKAENDGFSLPSNAFCAFLLEQTYHRSVTELEKFFQDKREVHAALLRAEIPKIKRGPSSSIARNLTVSWLEKSFELWKQGK